MVLLRACLVIFLVGRTYTSWAQQQESLPQPSCTWRPPSRQHLSLLLLEEKAHQYCMRICVLAKSPTFCFYLCVGPGGAAVGHQACPYLPPRLDAAGGVLQCACMCLQARPGAALDDAAGAGLRPVQAPRAQRPRHSAAGCRAAQRLCCTCIQEDPEDGSLACARGTITCTLTQVCISMHRAWHDAKVTQGSPENVTGTLNGSAAQL